MILANGYGREHTCLAPYFGLKSTGSISRVTRLQLILLYLLRSENNSACFVTVKYWHCSVIVWYKIDVQDLASIIVHTLYFNCVWVWIHSNNFRMNSEKIPLKIVTYFCWWVWSHRCWGLPCVTCIPGTVLHLTLYYHHKS